MVFVQGAAIKHASNAKELNALFEEGSKNRHVASTSQCSHILSYLKKKNKTKKTKNIPVEEIYLGLFGQGAVGVSFG